MAEIKRVSTKRNYVGLKETVGYVMFDSSKTFGIAEYDTRFLLDVVKIDLGWQTIIRLINSIWDIVNDSFIGVIVDKTRTRFGKFRPYLIAFAIPGTVGTVLYWLTPMFFGADPRSVGKAVYWLILAVLREGGGTFRSVAETGLLATVTPNPNERMGILTKSELFSSVYENFPEIAMSLLIDLVNNGKINFTLKSTYILMGVSTTVVGAFLAMFCFIVTKERIQQSLERPSIRDGLHTIITNRPMLMIMLSDLLGAFSISTGMNNYYLDVLGSMFIKNLIGLPSTPAYYVSFSYAAWARRKFSTKQLWVFTQHFGDLLTIIVFFIGTIGGKGKNGLYRKLGVMVPVLMVKEILWKSTFGIRKIIPRELFNEAMDYCEWKNGIRTEGMTTAAKSMLTKVVKNANHVFETFLLKRIGYDLNAGFGNQADKTKYMLFFMATFVPSATALLSSVPKFFYNINAQTRARMYEELMESRAKKQLLYLESEEQGATNQA